MIKIKRMILRFLVGSVAFHVLYYMLKNIVVPTFFADNTPKAVVAEIAKRLVTYKFDITRLIVNNPSRGSHCHRT